MDLFNKITISHFIWYLVPGLALEFFLLFPFFIISPPLAKAIFSNLGPVGTILVAIVLGFILDGLRLYRLRPRYDKTKQDFFDDLKTAVNANSLNPYFVQSRIADLAKQKEVSGIAIHHAIWIMLGHFSVLSILEAAFWILAYGYFYLFSDGPYPVLVVTRYWWKAATVYLALAAAYGLLGYRINKISIEDQTTTNNMFLDFAKQHVLEIKTMLNIP